MNKLLSYVFSRDNLTAAIAKAKGKGICEKDLIELCNPDNIAEERRKIRCGETMFGIPWTQDIPKNELDENGKMKYRTVYILPNKDRVIMGLANDGLFYLCPDMIHPACTSYQKGMSTGTSVKRVIETLQQCMRNGWSAYKMDLSKYFDSLPIEWIDQMFADIRQRIGEDALLNMVQLFYHMDWYEDKAEERRTKSKQPIIKTKYQSLKQGVAVASFLADAALYEMDARVSQLDVLYIRYSDDILCIGREADKGMEIIREELAKRGMKLNDNKTERLTPDSFFKFLGFSLRGDTISLSESRIRKFAKDIADMTVREIQNGITLDRALKNVMRYLYNPRGEYSWATAVLPVMNCKDDIQALNFYVLDCLRAVALQRSNIKVSDIGGLGYVRRGKTGCIERGTRTYKTENVAGRFVGYLSLMAAKNAMKTGTFGVLLRETCRDLYESSSSSSLGLSPTDTEDVLQCLDGFYQQYTISRPNEESERNAFRAVWEALPYDELETEDLLYGESREEVRRFMEQYLRESIANGSLRWDEKLMGNGWFYRTKGGVTIMRHWLQAG